MKKIYRCPYSKYEKILPRGNRLDFSSVFDKSFRSKVTQCLHTWYFAIAYEANSCHLVKGIWIHPVPGFFSRRGPLSQISLSFPFSFVFQTDHRFPGYWRARYSQSTYTRIGRALQSGTRCGTGMDAGRGGGVAMAWRRLEDGSTAALKRRHE